MGDEEEMKKITRNNKGYEDNIAGQRGDKNEMEKWLETKSRCKWGGKTMGDKEEIKMRWRNDWRRKVDANEMEKRWETKRRRKK